MFHNAWDPFRNWCFGRGIQRRPDCSLVGIGNSHLVMWAGFAFIGIC